MNSVHCGEPVGEKLEFKNYKKTGGDNQALIVLTRDPDDRVKSFVLDVVNNEVETKWPDVEKGADDWYGCAKVIMDGSGTWKQRFDRQIYFFEVIVGNDSKKSNTITIDPQPDKGKVTKKPSLSITVHNRTLGGIVGLFGAQKLPKLLDPKPWTSTSCEMGQFDLEFANGEVVITVAVQLNPTTAGVPADIFDRFKKRVEGFWNGGNGYGKYVLHWTGCKREKACDCQVGYDSNDVVVSGGCCKIPVRLVVENSARHGLTFDIAKVGFLAKYFAGAWAPLVNSSHGSITYPDQGNTWAHEIGHCIGLPDQYLGGHNWQPLGKFKNKMTSIMGAFQSEAYEEHLHYAEELMGSDFKVIEQSVNRP